MAVPQIIPLFILGFIALAILNSFGLVPELLRASIVSATPVRLTAAMAALGLGTSFAKMKERGFRPLVLSFLASVYIGATGLLLVYLI